MKGEPPDDVRAIHANLVTTLARVYRMVEREDIAQELWLSYYGSQWALNGPEKPTEGLEDTDAYTEYSDALKALRKEMRAAAEKYCRQEKAAKEGYEYDDEAYYSIGALKNLLEAWMVHGPVESPARTAESSVSRPKGSGQYGDYLVSLIDVGIAARRLPDRQKTILFHAYSPQYAGKTDEEIASELRSKGWQGMTQEKFSGAHGRALGLLQRQLGGRRV
jgi:hypothetical protein